MNAHSFRSLFSRRNLAALTVCLLFSCIAVCGLIVGRAQSDAKGEREMTNKIPEHIPIRLTVKNPEKVNNLKNDGWLGDLEIEVKNTGDKPIYFLRLGLVFEDVKKNSGGEIGYSLVYGRGGLIDIEQRPEPGDTPIQPGETYVFKLHESYVKGWNWYRNKVEKKPHPKKIEVIFSAINFGDGTGFSGTDGTPVPERSPFVKEKQDS